MKITVNMPTRVTETTSTCLDNIFVSNLVKSNTEVLDVNISDHFAQLLSIKDNIMTNTQTQECRRIFSSENYQLFCNLLV